MDIESTEFTTAGMQFTALLSHRENLSILHLLLCCICEMLSPSKAYSDTTFSSPWSKDVDAYPWLLVCNKQDQVGLRTLPCSAKVGSTLPAATRTLSLCRPNGSNKIFRGVEGLPMDQQSNLRSLILWPSIQKQTGLRKTSFPPTSLLLNSW